MATSAVVSLNLSKAYAFSHSLSHALRIFSLPPFHSSRLEHNSEGKGKGKGEAVYLSSKTWNHIGE
jgi:hypothetical protein